MLILKLYNYMLVFYDLSKLADSVFWWKSFSAAGFVLICRCYWSGVRLTDSQWRDTDRKHRACLSYDTGASFLESICY